MSNPQDSSLDFSVLISGNPQDSDDPAILDAISAVMLAEHNLSRLIDILQPSFIDNINLADAIFCLAVADLRLASLRNHPLDIQDAENRILEAHATQLRATLALDGLH